MVSGAHRDAFLVERGANVFGANVVEHERQDASFFASRSDQPQTGDREQSRRRVDQELVLVGGDALDPDLRDIVERRAESNSVGDVAGARLEACRGRAGK